VVGALVRDPLVAMAHLGGLPTPEPTAGAGVAVEHHRGDVVQGVLVGPGAGIDDIRRAGHDDHRDGAVIPLKPLVHVVR
jgi:hypothetical protein